MPEEPACAYINFLEEERRTAGTLFRTRVPPGERRQLGAPARRAYVHVCFQERERREPSGRTGLGMRYAVVGAERAPQPLLCASRWLRRPALRGGRREAPPPSAGI